MRNLTLLIRFRVRLLDKWKAGSWVTYPNDFASRDDAEDFVTALKSAAPLWKYRIEKAEIWETKKS